MMSDSARLLFVTLEAVRLQADSSAWHATQRAAWEALTKTAWIARPSSRMDTPKCILQEGKNG
jgi:hypothetical protein